MTGVRLADAATCPPPERRDPPALTVTSIYGNGGIAWHYLAPGLPGARENDTQAETGEVITTPAAHHQPGQGRHHRTPGTNAMTSTDEQRPMPPIQALAQVLRALAHDGGEPGQRAWAALAGMTARICGRYSAEARAVAACAAGGPDTASPRRLAGLLARRAGTDARFASGFLPWLAAAQALLASVPGGR